jgi:hypothetical protein
LGVGVEGNQSGWRKKLTRISASAFAKL